MKTKTGHYFLDLSKCTPMTNAVINGIENPVLLAQGHRHWQQHLLHPVWHLPPLGSVSSSSVSPANSWDGFILLPFVISLQQKHQTQWTPKLSIFVQCSPFLSGMTSACTNPVLYGFLNESFKKEFKEMYVCAFMENLFNSSEFEQLYIRNLKIKCSRKGCLFQMV